METLSKRSYNLWVRPEPNQLEHLSDASFLGKLLVFPANVRLDWKVIAGTNTLAHLALSTATKEIFYNIDTRNSLKFRTGMVGGRLGDSKNP